MLNDGKNLLFSRLGGGTEKFLSRTGKGFELYFWNIKTAISKEWTNIPVCYRRYKDLLGGYGMNLCKR